MSNSPLVNHTRISPNRTSPRKHKIDTVTIHCVVGQASVESLGNVFAPTSRKASSNYGVGVDGRIGMYVEEKDRSWCSSSASNDNRAITIEVASDTTHPYAVNKKAYAALIELLVDICKRNGIKELKWKADKSLIGQVDKQNMTVHRWFANKSCPGDYLYNKHGEIAAKVNALLGATTTTPAKPTTMYRVRKTWANAKSQIGAYCDLNNAKAVVDKNAGYFVFDSNGKVVYPVQSAAFKSYTVRVTAGSLNIRKGPGTNYSTNGAIKDKGIYTIVEEATGVGAKLWGKLKSGVGWISLDFTQKR